MRLIDADALEKDLRHEYEQAYQKFHAAKREDEKTEYGAASVTWLQAIFKSRKAPTVDAVEVVRCKDCKHFDPDSSVCKYSGWLMDGGSDFCSRGFNKEWSTGGVDDATDHV